MSKPRGFTLIELLVVIALITMLIGILVPYLGRGRFVGQMTVCQSNMNQTVKTCSTYAIGNRNWFPTDTWSSNSFKYNPNMVSQNILKIFNSYSLKWTIWFCPLRSLQVFSGKSIATPTASATFTSDQDAINKLFETGTGTPWPTGTDGSYYYPNFYWVPRTTGVQPIPNSDPMPGLYPAKIAQGSGGQRRPMFSDFLQDTAAPTASWPVSTTLWGGHFYRQLDSINAGYSDGSAERRSAALLKTSFNNPAGYWNFY